MDKIIGHEKQKQILKKMIDEDKIGHAYLFTGKDGIGKKLVAIEFAKQVMSSETSDSFIQLLFMYFSNALTGFTLLSFP